MDRFCGMMPSNEVEIEKYYKDESGFEMSIQAGPHGWSVLYLGGSAKFKDVDNTAEENFKEAYAVAVEDLGSLTIVEDEPAGEC